MAKMLNLSASGRKISEAELVVRQVFTAKYAQPAAVPTKQEATAKFNRARDAVQRAMRQGEPATTAFFERVQQQRQDTPKPLTRGVVKKRVSTKATHTA